MLPELIVVYPNEADLEAGVFTVSPLSRPLKEKAKRMLRRLRDSKTRQEAERAMHAIYETTSPGPDENDDYERRFSKLLYKLNGLPIIIFAISEFYSVSQELISNALIVLINMTYNEQKCRQCLMDIGGISILIDATARWHFQLDLIADTLLVMENISHSPSLDVKHEVAKKKCIHFVMNAMVEFPEDEILQRNSCLYLENISMSQRNATVLNETDIPSLLETVADRFMGKNRNIVKSARCTLRRLSKSK